MPDTPDQILEQLRRIDTRGESACLQRGHEKTIKQIQQLLGEALLVGREYWLKRWQQYSPERLRHQTPSDELRAKVGETYVALCQISRALGENPSQYVAGYEARLVAIQVKTRKG